MKNLFPAGCDVSRCHYHIIELLSRAIGGSYARQPSTNQRNKEMDFDLASRRRPSEC
jgi:hypothetical protein